MDCRELLIHRDTPKTLGMRADNLWPATKQAVVVNGAFAIALFVIGAAKAASASAAELPLVWPAVDVFRVLPGPADRLNSLLTNRLLSLVKRPWLASLIAGTIFSVLHWPNPVLVPLTLVAGIAMAWMFARERNILPLAAGQSLLGSLAWWAFPIAWHHMLRVGPGYYAPY